MVHLLKCTGLYCDTISCYWACICWRDDIHIAKHTVAMWISSFWTNAIWFISLAKYTSCYRWKSYKNFFFNYCNLIFHLFSVVFCFNLKLILVLLSFESFLCYFKVINLTRALKENSLKVNTEVKKKLMFPTSSKIMPANNSSCTFL